MADKKILIIEDEPTEVFALKKILQEANFKTSSASDGEEGLKKIKQNFPDLVLLDIRIPKINGFDFLQFVKKEDKTKNIPIIMLTNIEDKESIKRALALGASGYFVKAKTSPHELIGTIDKQINKKNETRE
ncbi:MAG: response regulator [Patescibacteria group bacterium]|nr:response regulator [Patescibacteria group bacterium]